MFAKICLAGIYRIAYKLHHLVCLKPGKPLTHARLIVVGSHLVGGAGKTPFSAWLAENLHEGKLGEPCDTIAILCHSSATDEAEMLREKLPFATVVATGNRYRTAHQLDQKTRCVICDDGFEDTRLTGATIIRLDRAPLPHSLRDLIPAGKCRSLVQDHPEPAIALGPDAVQFRIAKAVNASGEPCPAGATAICGIGDPDRFREDLAAVGIAPARIVKLPDHSKNFERSLLQIIRGGSQAVITEKDAARLGKELRQNPAVFVAYQEVSVSSSAFEAISALFSK